jgi:hypothetical protein
MKLPPTVAVSLILQDLAGGINDVLKNAAGQEIAFVLALQVEGVAQYVSNAARQDGKALMESLLARWNAGRADIPAHYNPDLKAEAPTLSDVEIDAITRRTFGTTKGVAITNMRGYARAVLAAAKAKTP